LLHGGFMHDTATVANIYVESITDLLNASPKDLKRADAFVHELHYDVVESLLHRAADLVDALNALAEGRDRLFTAIGDEQEAEEELARYRKESRKLARTAERRETAGSLDAEDSDDHGEADPDDHANEREQDQLEAHLIPAAIDKKAAAQAERVAGTEAAQDQLRQVLTALEAFDDR
jgi:hypothetical protein